ncbi:MAG: hypothetical protein IKQ10_07990 [Oscillospiraceae bacterium]|nr:hypothetical protein [Oscillospiraceae bacterium]
MNAEDGEFKHCVCPACGSPVIQRRGDTNRHHFAHDPRKRNDEKCPYDYNADYKNMSEWHIRMQEYFPKEEREHIFTDNETGEKHIADVFIKEANIVLEFQYSSIKKKEYVDRTRFHLKEGRRIAWLFNESWKDNDEESKSNHTIERFQLDKRFTAIGPNPQRVYKWNYRRKCVNYGPCVYKGYYSVCVYTGKEGDVFNRIIDLDSNYVTFSYHTIKMSSEIDVEEFFYPEEHWYPESLRQELEIYNKQLEEDEKQAIELQEYINNLSLQSQTTSLDNNEQNSSINRVDFDGQLLKETQRKVDRYKEQQQKMKEKDRYDREDYWKALLKYVDSIVSPNK